jgi:histidyl-tRNA synthetase
LNLRQQDIEVPTSLRPAVYVAHLSDKARSATADFARLLRQRGVPTVLGVGTRPLRARLRNADAAGVRWTALFGDDELTAHTVSLRDMAAAASEVLPLDAALDRLAGTAEVLA